ncbi:MAG: FAD-dependent oxidoreductase [Myxococcota bacterium]
MTNKPERTSFDAVIIGTGVGGSTFAYGLAKRGLNVAVVERGDYYKPETKNFAPVHVHYFQKLMVIGGQTKAYGAAMYRFRERDFQAVEMEAGVSPAWPINYSDLEPFYCEAEKLFKVHGSSAHDPTEPPRSQPWPYAPIPHQGPARELVQRVSERAGVPVSHIPRAIDYDPDNGGKCVLCRHCDAYYCPRDAKLDAEVGALRPAVETGRVTVLTNTECLRVLTTPDGKRVTGVQLRRGGEEFTLNTGIVASGCGLRETPLLFWRSRTSQHPKGLANGSGALGRNWAAHTQGWVFPIQLGVQKEEWHQKTFAINSFYESGVIQAAGNIEPIGMSRRYRYVVDPLIKNSFQTFVMTEALPSLQTGYALSDDGAKTIGEPISNKQTFKKLRKKAASIFRAAGYTVFVPPQLSIFHSVGTARMGSDPATSVVNGDCKAHDIDGLFVVDSCALPTSGALNSGLTVAAVALRAAARAQLAG